MQKLVIFRYILFCHVQVNQKNCNPPLRFSGYISPKGLTILKQNFTYSLYVHICAKFYAIISNFDFEHA